MLCYAGGNLHQFWLFIPSPIHLLKTVVYGECFDICEACRNFIPVRKLYTGVSQPQILTNKLHTLLAPNEIPVGQAIV